MSNVNVSGCGTGRRYRYVHCVNVTADVTEERLCDMAAGSKINNIADSHYIESSF